MSKKPASSLYVGRWLTLLALSLLLVPIVVFLGGQVLAGPYEGEGGIFGLMAGLYSDALSGHLSALILLFSPLLLVLLWMAAFWLRNTIGRRQLPPPDNPQD